MHIPFLPTIVTALVIAAASFLCQETAVSPTPVATAQAMIDATSFADGRLVASEPAAARPPAVLAFAQFHPLVFEAAEPKVAVRAAPHFAVLPPRRACFGTRCGETAAIPRRANPFAAAKTMEAKAMDTKTLEAERVDAAPVEIGSSDGPSFPSVALPFAPVARVVGQATGMMRSGASALGSSAMMLVDRMR